MTVLGCGLIFQPVLAIREGKEKRVELKKNMETTFDSTYGCSSFQFFLEEEPSCYMQCGSELPYTVIKWGLSSNYCERLKGLKQRQWQHSQVKQEKVNFGNSWKHLWVSGNFLRK